MLTNSLVKFTIGHSCADRGDPFVVEGRVPGGDPAYGRTGASCIACACDLSKFDTRGSYACGCAFTICYYVRQLSKFDIFIKL